MRFHIIKPSSGYREWRTVILVIDIALIVTVMKTHVFEAIPADRWHQMIAYPCSFCAFLAMIISVCTAQFTRHSVYCLDLGGYIWWRMIRRRVGPVVTQVEVSLILTPACICTLLELTWFFGFNWRCVL